MLPNHSALAVAEQFALLESMFPGRIDLGVGRAPGSDPVTAHLLRGGTVDAEEAFPRDVALLARLLGVEGDLEDHVEVRLGGSTHPLRATPRLATAPELWLLGSSSYSAALAAATGLPYAFAHHFGAPGLAEALARYRGSFDPGPSGRRPRTLVPVNVVVDPDPELAARRALPQKVQMTELRTTGRVGPQLTVEEAERHEWTDVGREVARQVSRRWLVGTPAEVVTGLSELATEHDVDELMVVPATGSFAGERDPADGPRVRTLRLLAAEVGSEG
jgi:luciferase family oxidoreductase group 1